jgi:hypothetical protein
MFHIFSGKVQMLRRGGRSLKQTFVSQDDSMGTANTRSTVPICLPSDAGRGIGGICERLTHDSNWPTQVGHSPFDWND